MKAFYFFPAPPPNAAAGRGESLRSKRKSSKGKIVPCDGPKRVEKEGRGGDTSSADVIPRKRSLDHFYSNQEVEGEGEGGGEGRDRTVTTLSPTVNGIEAGGGERGGNEHSRKKAPAKKRSSQSTIAPISTRIQNDPPPSNSPSNPEGLTSPGVFISADSGRKRSIEKSASSHSRSKIASIHMQPPQNGLPDSPLNPATAATPLGVFFVSDNEKKEGSKGSSKSFEYPPTAINAWGSTSSLDRYIDSLPAEKLEEGIENHSSSIGTSKSTYGDTESEIEGHFSSKESERYDTVFHTVNSNSGNGIQNGANAEEVSGEDNRGRKTAGVDCTPESKRSPLLHRFTEGNIASNYQNGDTDQESPIFRQSLSDASHKQQIPSPQSEQSNSSHGEHDQGDHQIHIRSLQEASSATIVAVSPAPREHRTSYAMHGQSKLNRAEANRKVFHFETADTAVGVKPPAREGSLVREADWSGWDESRRRTGPVLDSGSFHQVRPDVITVASSEPHGNTPDHLQANTSEPSSSTIPKPLAEEVGTSPSLGPKHEKGSFHTQLHAPTTKETADSADAKATGATKHIVVQSKKSADTTIPPKLLQKSENDGATTSKSPVQQTIGYKARGTDGSSVSKIFVQPLTRGKTSSKRAARTVSKEEREGSVPPSPGHPQGEEEEEEERSSPSPGVGSSRFATAYSSAVTSIHSSTATRIKDDKLEGLKAINLPPLKKLELTDIYVGKYRTFCELIRMGVNG